MAKDKKRERKTEHQKEVERWMENFYQMHKLLGFSGEYIMELAESGLFKDDGQSRPPSDPSIKKLLEELVDDPHQEISQAQFARIMGVDRSVISRLCERRVLAPGVGFQVWYHSMTAYGIGYKSGRKASGYGY